MNKIESEVITARFKLSETKANAQSMLDFVAAKQSPTLLALIDEWPHLPLATKNRVRARAWGEPIPPLTESRAQPTPEPSIVLPQSNLPTKPKATRPNSQKRWRESARERYLDILYHWERGKTIEQIANILNRTPKGIESAISRARLKWGLFKADRTG